MIQRSKSGVESLEALWMGKKSPWELCLFSNSSNTYIVIFSWWRWLQLRPHIHSQEKPPEESCTLNALSSRVSSLRESVAPQMTVISALSKISLQWVRTWYTLTKAAHIQNIQLGSPLFWKVIWGKLYWFNLKCQHSRKIDWFAL